MISKDDSLQKDRDILTTDEEVHSLYHSPNVVRVIKSGRLRWAEHVARMKEGRSALKILTGKPTGKRLLGRLRGRGEDNSSPNTFVFSTFLEEFEN